MAKRLADEPLTGRLFAGLAAPFAGLAFLARRPHLWVYTAIPVALMIAGVIGSAWFAFGWTPGAAAAVIPPPRSGVLAGLWWGVVFVLMLVLFAACAVVSWAASTVLATPFYDALAGRVEEEVTGVPVRAFDLSAALGDAGISIAHTLMAAGLYALATVALSLLGFVPVVDLVVPFAELALTAAFVARELLDFPLSRRRLGFAEKIGWLREHGALFGGLGATSTALLWIPVLNFVSMPAAVVGCTLLVCRIEAEASRPQPMG